MVESGNRRKQKDCGLNKTSQKERRSIAEVDSATTKQSLTNNLTIKNDNVAGIFEISHWRSGMAGFNIYYARSPANGKGFEIPGGSDGGIMGRKS